jgi:hypothetical protein
MRFVCNGINEKIIAGNEVQGRYQHVLCMRVSMNNLYFLSLHLVVKHASFSVEVQTVPR